eukprot:g27157.t1
MPPKKKPDNPPAETPSVPAEPTTPDAKRPLHEDQEEDQDGDVSSAFSVMQLCEAQALVVLFLLPCFTGTW